MSIIDRLKAALGRSVDPAAFGDAESITCRQALQLVHDYMDGELEDVPKTQVAQHFDVCRRCYPHLRFETAFKEALRRVAGGEGAPPELRSRLLSVLAEVEPED